MKNLPIISIVIPVYNVDKYLSRCLDSRLNQSFENFEVLLIDDGSTDSSFVICKDYMSKDQRIFVYHQTNKGANAARAAGVRLAKSDWINFVDADDYLPKDALLNMFLASEKDNSDIVMCSSMSVGDFHRVSPLGIKGVLSRKEYIKAMLTHKCGFGPVCKLIKKTLFTNDVFDIPSDIKNNEDLIMNIRLAKNALTISSYPGVVVYNYFIHEGSLSHAKQNISTQDKVFECLFKDLDIEFEPYIKMFIVQYFYDSSISDLQDSCYFNYILNNRSKKETLLFKSYMLFLVRRSSIANLFIKLNFNLVRIKKLLLYVFGKHTLKN